MTYGPKIWIMVAAAMSPISAAQAQNESARAFYANKTVEMVVGTGPANDFDFRGRLIAKYIGKYIPGNPTVVVRNMPGAGGVVAMNWLANVAAHDGTKIHMLFPAMGISQAVKWPGVNFDLRRFALLGNTTDSPNILVTWKQKGILTIEDAKKRDVILGSTPGNTGLYYANALNQMIGTRFKVISGYPSTNDVTVAMERGEVEGRASNTLSSWEETKPDWFREHKLSVLFQVALKAHPDLPGVPLLQDLATNAGDRAILELFTNSAVLARAVVTTPDVPADRLAALREAFDQVIKDPELLAEARERRIDISALDGPTSQRISDAVVNAPSEIISKAKAFMDVPQ
jgi:tripartite-type tricarboxylate transporter receptor subunit TctC